MTTSPPSKMTQLEKNFWATAQTIGEYIPDTSEQCGRYSLGRFVYYPCMDGEKVCSKEVSPGFALKAETFVCSVCGCHNENHKAYVYPQGIRTFADFKKVSARHPN